MYPSEVSLSLLFLLLLLPMAISTEICQTSFCSTTGGVAVKFPFQLTNSLYGTSARCVHPGFELSCFRNETIIRLPYSGPFVVKNIDYNTQSLYINDPENCLPKRFLNNFTFASSQFFPDFIRSFTFYNCTSNVPHLGHPFRTVPCLGGENYTVRAIPSRFYGDLTLPSLCQKISSVLIPFSPKWTGFEDDVRLSWNSPLCAYCEDQGQACGFKSDTGLDTGCSDTSRSGMSTSAKYGLIIGIGVPGILCVIGLGCYICGKVKTRDEQRRHAIAAQLSTSIVPPLPSTIFRAGLDRPTIESYPKTLLGESRRLPKPNDNTCPICLCEYQPKETLRTIPDCNHYFHADCIDKWLRMNASCPLCRNSPEGSISLISPSFTPASSHSTSVLSP